MIFLPVDSATSPDSSSFPICSSILQSLLLGPILERGNNFHSEPIRSGWFRVWHGTSLFCLASARVSHLRSRSDLIKQVRQTDQQNCPEKENAVTNPCHSIPLGIHDIESYFQPHRRRASTRLTRRVAFSPDLPFLLSFSRSFISIRIWKSWNSKSCWNEVTYTTGVFVNSFSISSRRIQSRERARAELGSGRKGPSVSWDWDSGLGSRCEQKHISPVLNIVLAVNGHVREQRHHRRIPGASVPWRAVIHEEGTGRRRGQHRR